MNVYYWCLYPGRHDWFGRVHASGNRARSRSCGDASGRNAARGQSTDRARHGNYRHWHHTARTGTDWSFIVRLQSGARER